MKNFKIHLYSICYNEQVMLPHFIDHYSSFCDKLFIYDNFSTDLSPDICKNNAKVEFLNFETGGEIRDDVYLTIKNNVWKRSRGEADFVIVCDVDEFLYHNNLIEEINELIKNNVTLVKPQGYNMVSELLPTKENNIIVDFKMGVRSESFDKVIIFNPNKIDEINYQAGSHKCFPVGSIKYSSTIFKLLHYKYLNLEYLLARYDMFATRLSKFNKINKLGIHYSFSKRKIKNEFNHLLSICKNIVD